MAQQWSEGRATEGLPVKDQGRREKNEEGGHGQDELPASAVLAKALLAKRRQVEQADRSTELPPPAYEAELSLPPRQDSLLAREVTPPTPVIDKSLPATPEPTPPSTRQGRLAQPIEESGQALMLSESVGTLQGSLLQRPPHSRHLSAAESDSISQWSRSVTSFSAPTPKPKKKKLGPRPHVEPHGRPKTSGTTDESSQSRPVANLPNTVRVSNRPVMSSTSRPYSQQSTQSVPTRLGYTGTSHSHPPPLPPSSHIASLYQNPQRLAPSRASSATTDGQTATPEKLRLMKALQMRKRNMLLAQRASTMRSSSSTGIENRSSATAPNVSADHMSSISSTRSDLQELGIRVNQESSTTSPTSMSTTFEQPSTKASSFTMDNEAKRSQESLSSGTVSPLTPKAYAEDDETRTGATRDIKTSDKPPGFLTTRSMSQPQVDTIDEDENEDNDVQKHTQKSAIDEAFERLTGEQASTLPETDMLPASPVKDANVHNRQVRRPPPLSVVSDSSIGNKGRARRAVHDPTKTESSFDGSDLSDDESFMDELQHATVHEAKPVSVARTPVTPIMSRIGSDRFREMSRSVSATAPELIESVKSTPEKGTTASLRNASTALPQWPPATSEMPSVPLSKKPTLGSGISKRIKALETLTNRDREPSTTPPQSPNPSAPRSTFKNFMKRSSFVGHTQLFTTPSEAPPPVRVPENKSVHKSAPHQGVPSTQRQSTVTEVDSPAQKGETISVTARIVRDGTQVRKPGPENSVDFSLHRSPLLIEHERNDTTSERAGIVKSTSMQTTESVTITPRSDKTRFSFSSGRSNSQSRLAQSESMASRMSSKKNTPQSQSENSSLAEEKSKASRTSRLMKRMSNLASGSKRAPKAQLESTTEEDYTPASSVERNGDHERQASISGSILHVVDIGDVNVQFPDTLLWKRRFVRIDDQGYLIFSAPSNEANARAINRRFHLSDFKQPALPDREREEMAWSIVLDLRDGSCVQCACESKHAQRHVLQSKSYLLILSNLGVANNF